MNLTPEQFTKFGDEHLEHLRGLWFCEYDTDQSRSICEGDSNNRDGGLCLFHIKLHDRIRTQWGLEQPSCRHGSMYVFEGLE